LKTLVHPAPTHQSMDQGGGINALSPRFCNEPRPVVQRRRRDSVVGQFLELSPETISDVSEYDNEDGDDTNVGDAGSDDFRHDYRDETWPQKCFTYDPKP
jgi:hypothetical protein